MTGGLQCDDGGSGATPEPGNMAAVKAVLAGAVEFRPAETAPAPPEDEGPGAELQQQDARR